MHATSLLRSTRALIPVPHRTPPKFSAAHLTAQALALSSLALGALEVAKPARLARQIRLRGKEPALHRHRREIAAGLGALGHLAPLTIGRRAERHTARNISIAVGAVAGIALVNLGVAALLARRARR